MDLLMLIFALPGTPLVVAGGMGGVARWLMVILLDKKMAVSQGLATVALGAILGYYASPSLVDGTSGLLAKVNFTTDPEKLPTFTAFATGVLGVALMGLFLDWFAAWRKKLIPETPVDPVLAPNPSPTGDGK